LFSQVQQLLALDKEFVLKYKDIEGDLITLASNEELACALNYSDGNILRLFTVPKDTPAVSGVPDCSRDFPCARRVRGGRCHPRGGRRHQKMEKRMRKGERKRTSPLSEETKTQIATLKSQINLLKPAVKEVKIQIKAKKDALKETKATGGDPHQLLKEILVLKETRDAQKSQVKPLKQKIRELKYASC